VRNCLVLGSGRSGTSMVAGILAKSGYNTGDDYIDARQSNPAGFFEDRSVNRTNDAILRTTARARHRLLPSWVSPRRRRKGTWALNLPEPIYRVPPDGAVSTMADLVSRTPFAYKDPRLCYTLPAWQRHLPDGTVKLCVFREPGRTATSIVREFATAPYLARERMTYRHALRVWTAMYRSVLEMCDGDPGWRFVHFDQVVNGVGIDRMEEKLETPLDRSHVDPALKRSADPGGALPVETAAVYRTLCWAALHEH
jgi:hypothetical protein